MRENARQKRLIPETREVVHESFVEQAAFLWQ
jgi:hypothetical protein